MCGSLYLPSNALDGINVKDKATSKLFMLKCSRYVNAIWKIDNLRDSKKARGLKQSRLIELYLYNEYNHEMNQNRTRKRFPPFFLSKMKGKEYLLTRQKKMMSRHSQHDLKISKYCAGMN